MPSALNRFTHLRTVARQTPTSVAIIAISFPW